MFISNMLNMSHRHLVPFIRSKPANITKEIIKVEKKKINNKLMKPIIKKDTLTIMGFICLLFPPF